MTERQQEALTLIYALTDAIAVKDWPTAKVICDRLLLVHAPLMETYSDECALIRRSAEMVQLAGQQTRQVH